MTNCRWHRAGLEGPVNGLLTVYPMDSTTRAHFDALQAPHSATVRFPDGCPAVLDDLSETLRTGQWRIVASPMGDTQADIPKDAPELLPPWKKIPATKRRPK